MELVPVIALGAVIVVGLAFAITLEGQARQRRGLPRWSRTMVVLFAILVLGVLSPIVYVLVRVVTTFAAFP